MGQQWRAALGHMARTDARLGVPPALPPKRSILCPPHLHPAVALVLQATHEESAAVISLGGTVGCALVQASRV